MHVKTLVAIENGLFFVAFPAVRLPATTWGSTMTRLQSSGKPLSSAAIMMEFAAGRIQAVTRNQQPFDWLDFEGVPSSLLANEIRWKKLETISCH